MDNQFSNSTTAVVPTENKTSVANIPAENSNAATPAPSLAQRVIKIQFHLQNMANSAIIIGQELIECKKEIEKEFGYGYWGKWLEDNFHLKERSARNFMEIAERFGMSNSQLRQMSAVLDNLSYSQMAEMLLLPAEDTEKFIAEKTAEGTPVENMTIKKLRAEIKDWKAQAEKQKARAEDAESRVRAKQAQYEDMVHTYNNNFFAMQEEKDAQLEELKKENEELKKDNALKLDVNRSNAEEYFKLRAEKEQEIANLNDKIAQLEAKLAEPTIEIFPADDEEKENLRKEVATLKAREQNFRTEIATSQALNQFFMLANFLSEHQDCLPEVLKGYVNSDPLTSQCVNQSSDLINLLKKFLADISN